MVKKEWFKKIVAAGTAMMMMFSVLGQGTLGGGVVLAEEAKETKTIVGTENSINEELKLWYRTPANINTAETDGGEWMQQSLPLGNGDLGNLVFGGISKERIHFNEKSLWTGGPSNSRPNYQFGNKSTAYTASEIEAYRQILDDKSKNVFNDSMSGYGYVAIRFPGENNLNKGSYQDFGDIWLDFGSMGVNENNVQDYRRELNLQTGIASTTFTYNGVEYERSHFVSNPDQVMVTRLDASEKGKIDVTIQMELNNGNLAGNTSIDSKNKTCTIEGTVKDNGLKFRTTMKIVPTGGTLVANSNQTFTVSGADQVLIVMAAETDYKNDYPVYRDTEMDLKKVVDGRVEDAAKKGYDQLREAHLMDHQALFDRVSLDLGEVVTDLPTNQLVENYRKGEHSKYLEVLSFQFGRYLTIAGSRGSLPSNLVGLWTVGDSAWTGDYHFNVNVQMNYWPVYVTNLAECGTTMVEYMENLREPGRLTAERVHGIEGAVEDHTGFVVHTENNPFGMTAPSNAQEYGWNPTGAAWAIQNLWAHYEFTEDEAYLEEVIYPIMKEAALFWDQYLWTSSYQVINDESSPYNGESRVVVAPSFSEEQGPTAVGTTYDQSLVWELYKECIAAGEIVGEDLKLLKQWEETMQKLDPIEINATNGIKEWYEETRVGADSSGHNRSYAQAGKLAEIAVPNSGWNIGHPGEQRHASHLVGLYPGTLINKENETYLNAAIQSLTERGEYSTGWSKANKINLWARTGNGDKAYRLLNNLIGGNTSGLQYNLFDSHGSGGGETMKNGRPVWQIDGNYGLTAGVAEMLLQSQLGYVQFLPAIPKDWKDGNVQGLKARGNFTVGQIWEDGAPIEFTVCYEGKEASSEFVGEYKEITDAKVYADGAEVAVEKDKENGRISFEAKQGIVYTIDMSGTNVEKVGEAIETLLEESEAIYYMIPENGLTEQHIDEMYWQLKGIQTAMSNGTLDKSDYRVAKETLEEMIAIFEKQLENRIIEISKTGNDVTLKCGKLPQGAEIRYTVDGTDPGKDSAIYEGAFSWNAGTSLLVKAAMFLEEQRISPVYKAEFLEQLLFDGVQTEEENWTGYDPQLMIDGKSDTRWASLSPSGDVELIFSFNEPQTVAGMVFEQYVSYRNATDGFEILAWNGSAYEKVYEGTDLGDDGDATGQYFASKTVEFEPVTTNKMKVVVKAGYVGEPSFWEIRPMQASVKEVSMGNKDALNALLKQTEDIDRSSYAYGEVDADLRSAFEAAVESASAVEDESQAELDSVKVFLRNRYERLKEAMAQVKPKKSVTEIFSDVYQDWYTGYVQYVYDNELMTGIKGTNRFEPNANITKAQVAQVLYNMEGQPRVENQAVFKELKDVYESEWYGAAVAWAYSTGVVTGDTNAKKFFPNADVSREQLAIMMYRYAKYKQYDVSKTSDLKGLKNSENTANWALDGVKWAVGTGLISGIEKNGVKDLAPQGNASRGQVAAILQRFCQAYVK